MSVTYGLYLLLATILVTFSLVPGNPDELQAKVPQAVNLNAFPTTFVLGRDGRVRATHAGFPSPGSGEFYRKAERDVRAEVERLLAERDASRR